MKLILLFLTVLLCNSINAAEGYFYSPKVDSSEESSILFVQMKAVSSSKIVHFSWEVEEEQNGDHFVVEKSIDDGTTWARVSRVESIGNHKERHTYKISEINMIEGITEYFRVRRVDVDGETKVLDAININHPILYNMKLIPNPKNVRKATTISCESLICSDGVMKVYNSDGELIQDRKLNLSKGYNRCQIEVKKLEPGEYRVSIYDEFDNKLTKRLVVH
ncbi:MAG: hypothetical protein P8P74_18080 [Crocinitomicaceae bacterium]|nr:hypothetical protein [Crocinitomicaceae bacterium]